MIRTRLAAAPVLVIAAVAVCLCVGAANARVAKIKLSDLVKSSERIMVARVDGLLSFDGLVVARAIPQRVLKGQEAQTPIYFVAGPTWACDASTAIRGETVVLFLAPATSERFNRKLINKPEAQITAKPLYLLAHSGRGRWPITTRQGREMATVSDDITLPDELALGEKGEQGRPRVGLSELARLIRKK